MINPFIKIYKILDEALSTLESPQTEFFSNNGVQLLPNQTNPYTQVSDNVTGIELEDWTVSVKSICGETLANVTGNFMVFDNIVDDDGMPQIIWSLTNIAYDFGYQFVYLEINQLVGETFYTSPFQITDNKSEFTSRFDYKAKNLDWYQSIQLQTWFRQKLNKDNLTTYYEISTRNTVTVATKTATIEKWQTELFNNELFVSFRNMLNSKYLYCNLIRCNLYEAFEIPTLEMDENFKDTDYTLSFNYKEILNENINEMTILEQLEFLMSVVKPITDGGVIWIWDKPANLIPAGYEECIDIAGKTIFGRLEDDDDFGLLGQEGGFKTKALSAGENAPHKHLMYANEQVTTYAGVTNVNQVAIQGFDGGGGGNENYTMRGTSTVATIGLTSESGSGTAFSILNPYRVVNFIKWVGLP